MKMSTNKPKLLKKNKIKKATTPHWTKKKQFVRTRHTQTYKNQWQWKRWSDIEKK